MNTKLQLLLKLRYSARDHREYYMSMIRRRNWGHEQGVSWTILDEYEKAYCKKDKVFPLT